MKSVILAVLVPVATADCILKDIFGDVEITCAIPSSTRISDKCCSLMQGMVDQSRLGPQPPAEGYRYRYAPASKEMQEALMACMSFQKYVVQHIPSELLGGPRYGGYGGRYGSHGPMNEDQAVRMVIDALPDGLRCTEKVVGGGEPACALHAEEGKLGVTCNIPKETEITPQCCSIIQGSVDGALQGRMPSPQDRWKAMQACSNFSKWGQEQAQKSQMVGHVVSGLGFPQNVVSETMANDMLPSGFSCKETISSNKMISLYANRPILSTIGLVTGFGDIDISEEASGIPLVMSGIAGFLAGGLLIAGVLSCRSLKQSGNQYHLLSEPQVA